MSRRYFLAFYIITSCLVSGQPLTYHLQGTVLHLKPDTTGQPDNILWKHDGNKVVDFDGREEQLYGQFQNRVTLDWVSAELSITDLRYDDSGEYELEIFTNKILRTFRYKVEVIGKVPKPTISCDMNNGNSNTHGTQATLTCSADPQSSMSYEWDSHGEVLPGPNLTISLEGEHDDKTYTCRVSNPLTTETATFTAKNCYSEESSSVALAAGIVGSIILLLLVVLGIGLCIRKRKERIRGAFGKQQEPGSAEARFAEIMRESLRKQLPPDPGEAPFAEIMTESLRKQLPPDPAEDMETARDDICTPLLKREITLPSTQRLGHLNRSDRDMQPGLPVYDHKEDIALEMEEEEGLEKNTDRDKQTTSPPCSPGRKPSPCQDLDNLPGKDKGEAEADQLRGPSENKVPECDSSDTEKENEPDQFVVLDDSEDTQSEVEPSAAPEHPGYVQNVISKFEPNKRNDGGQMPPLDTRTDAEADQLRGPSENKVPECDSSDTEKANKPDQVAVFGDSEDTQSEVEPSPAPELPGYVQNVISKFEPNKRNDGGQMPPLDTRTDAEADQLRGPSENKVPECDSSDTEKANKPDQVAVLDNSEDTQSEVEPSPAPELPESENEEEKSPPNRTSRPIPRPRLRRTKSSSHMGTKDTAGEHKEDAKSDQVIGETSEKTVRESDSPGSQERNESDD